MREKVLFKGKLVGDCDTCSVPKMVNSGNGISEPLNPILYCNIKEIEIDEIPIKEQIIECDFFNQPVSTKNNSLHEHVVEKAVCEHVSITMNNDIACMFCDDCGEWLF